MRIVIDAAGVREASGPERDFFRDVVRNLLLRGGGHSYRIVGWPWRECGDFAAFLSPIPRNAAAWAVEPGNPDAFDRPSGALAFAPLGNPSHSGGSARRRDDRCRGEDHPLVTTVLGEDAADNEGRSHDPTTVASHAIVLSRGTREAAARDLGLPRPRIRWIPPPAGTCTSWEQPETAWSAEAGPYVATSVDGISVERFRSLLAGFRMYLRGTSGAARLLVFGRPRLSHRRSAWWSGISARVIFAGCPPRGARSALLASARAFVASASGDRAWFATGEAMAAGIPLIVPSTGKLPEIVGDAGLRYDVHRPEDLASQLWRCLEEEELPRALAQRSLRRARALCWESFTLRVLDFLAEVEQDLPDGQEAELESLSRV